MERLVKPVIFLFEATLFHLSVFHHAVFNMLFYYLKKLQSLQPKTQLWFFYGGVFFFLFVWFFFTSLGGKKNTLCLWFMLPIFAETNRAYPPLRQTANIQHLCTSSVCSVNRPLTLVPSHSLYTLAVTWQLNLLNTARVSWSGATQCCDQQEQPDTGWRKPFKNSNDGKTQQSVRSRAAF